MKYKPLQFKINKNEKYVCKWHIFAKSKLFFYTQMKNKKIIKLKIDICITK